MARRKARTPRKVDLRKAYEMGGYKCAYATFVRTKVVPIIGSTALHSKASREGSREKEYLVTERNFHRVVKSLGIEDSRYSKLIGVKKAISRAGPSATAEMILKLVERTSQPAPSSKFPLQYRIPMHPISNNMLYKAHRGKFITSPMYKKWKQRFAALMSEIVSDEPHGVDFSKPLEVIYKFGHRETNDNDDFFDRTNFQKGPQDCIFEYFGSDDSKVLDSSIRGEFVDSYDKGYIEFSIRNT